MSCLLDTHALLWTLFDPCRLDIKAADKIRNPEVTVSVSVVSFWEISLKYDRGKLELSDVAPDDFPDIVRQSGLTYCRLPRPMLRPLTTCPAWNIKTHLTA